MKTSRYQNRHTTDIGTLKNIHSLLALLFALGCLGIATTLHAQHLAAGKPPQFKFERLSVESGLSQCTVQAMFQDSRGFMWFGTADGLNRYDGFNFKKYRHDPADSTSISHNGVTSIAEDNAGYLWIGASSGGGLNRYDFVTGKFTLYKHNPKDSSSLSDDDIRAILKDSFGVLWIGTNIGLNELNPTTGKFISYLHDDNNPQSLSHNGVNELYEDRSKTLWLLTGAGLDKFDRRTRTFKHYEVKPAKNAHLQALYEDSNGIFWIGTAEGKIMTFDREQEKFNLYYQFKPLLSTALRENEIGSFYEDATGALWVGTSEGLSRLNRNDRLSARFTHYRHDKSDPSSIGYGPCNNIYEDHSGVLWIASDGTGLNKVDTRPPKFQHYKHDPNHANSLGSGLIKAIYEDSQGDLWVGSFQGGLDRLNRRSGEWTRFRHNANDPWSLNENSVFAICEDNDGLIWVGTGNGAGLNIFDRHSNRFSNINNQIGKQLKLTRYNTVFIYGDKAGNMWLSADGLIKYEKNTGRITSYLHHDDDPNSLSHNGVTVIYEDRRGRLWVGTQNGLNKFDPIRETFERFFHDPANPNSLGHNYIKSIWEDEIGTLWIGTTDGLSELDPEKEIFTRYHEKDGLPNPFIYGILGDDHGNLWMSTNKGLSKLDPKTGRFRNYDLKDGLQSYEFNTGAYHRSKITGEMIFGGINGFNIFHPDSVKDDPFVPPIVLTEFMKFDVPAPLEADISAMKEIKLAYEDDVFSFEFAALDFTHPEKNQYAYMMEGVDKNWVYCGNRRHARYTHLEPGSYTFRVKGSNHDGVWNEEGTSIKITIVPPLWMMWWFRILVCVAAIVGVAGGVRYFATRRLHKKLEEMERQQAIERERARISQDLHDELGANLTTITVLSELSRNEKANGEKLQAHLQKISETAVSTIDSMGEIIWAIKPQNNTLDNLAAYLRKHAATYFEMTPLHCHLDFPDHVPDYHLSGEFCRHIYMTVKEAVHNVVKHASATEVEMKFISYDHTIEILVKDNGRGFSRDSISGLGNGLVNMSKRIAEVGGVLEIQSQPNGGTAIRICAKIK